MNVARGFAVIDGKGNIIVRTVTDSIRSAKVNWLYMNGYTVLDIHSDDAINYAFETARGKCEVVEVEVRRRLNS